MRVRYVVQIEVDEDPAEAGVEAARAFRSQLGREIGYPFEVVARRRVGEYDLPLAELGPDDDRNSINFEI